MKAMREPAIKSYFFGKGYQDLVATIGESWSRNMRTAEDFFGRAPGGDRLDKVFMSGIWYTAAVSVVVFGTIFFLFASSVHAIILGLVFVFVYSGFTVLWFVEAAYLGLRRFFMACPHCHEHTMIPEYYCPACGRVHGQLRPNSFGIMRHTCICGKKLPATFWMNRGGLQARCPKCKESLAREHIESSRMFIAVVGGPSTGKTSFLFGAARAILEAGAGGLGYEAKIFDKRSEVVYSSAVRLLEGGVPPEKTRDAIPRAFHVALHKDGKLRYLLYLYDPAGEAYHETDTIAQHGFQNYVSGMVFLIDPFAVGAVRALYGAELKTHATAIKPSALPIEDALDRLLLSLEVDFGLKKCAKVRWPLAIVLNKVDAFDLPDVVGHKALEQAYEQEATVALRDYETFCDKFIRRQLCIWGERAFVKRVESRFEQTRFFVCSALGRMPDEIGADYRAISVMAPMKWIFEKAEQRDFVSDGDAR